MWSVQHFIVWGQFERTACSQQTRLYAWVCVCVCVSQQQAVSIKERNCSIILATATNQLVHLCPSQLLERTWTNSSSTRGTDCLFVHCIRPAEWIDPFTSADKGMKGNKMCILYSLIHLRCPFMQFTQAISEGNSNTCSGCFTILIGWKNLAQTVAGNVKLEHIHYQTITYILFNQNWPLDWVILAEHDHHSSVWRSSHH